jgi:2-C-methyl-D-erythritol 4-phosphate cytidylyltransferase
VLLAAGNSTRFSKKDNKLLSKFNNKTLLEHNIEFIKKQNFKKLTLVIDKKIKIIDTLNNIEIIKGGASRQESVINALN